MVPLSDFKSHGKCRWTRLKLLNDTLNIKHFLYSILLEQITVYQVFPACIHFPLFSREYQNRENCNRENLTQSCKLKLLLGFREKFTLVDF